METVEESLGPANSDHDHRLVRHRTLCLGHGRRPDIPGGAVHILGRHTDRPCAGQLDHVGPVC